MHKKSWLILLIIVLLGAACNPAVRSESIATADDVIIYQREGGFAGLSQEWTIYSDGTVYAPGEQELAADPDDIAELLSLSTSAEVSALDGSYVPKDNCCDKNIYTVTITDGDQEKTIRTTDDAQQPEELTELLAAIEELIANASTAE